MKYRSISSSLDRTDARSVNVVAAGGLEGDRPSKRSFQIHSAPYRCASVSRTEPKLEPRLRPNCSFVSEPQTSIRRRSAHRLYWNKKRSSSGVTIGILQGVDSSATASLLEMYYWFCGISVPRCSAREWYDSSSEGKVPSRTSRQYSAAAREIIWPTSA